MPVTTASFRPVDFEYASSLEVYEATPVKLSTSTLTISASISSKVQVSTSEWMRSRAPMWK